MTDLASRIFGLARSGRGKLAAAMRMANRGRSGRYDGTPHDRRLRAVGEWPEDGDKFVMVAAELYPRPSCEHYYAWDVDCWLVSPEDAKEALRA